MPAALNVDWETIKLVAQQIGVTEAARQFGLSHDAVFKRSSREGWLKEKVLPPEAQAAIEKHHEEKGTAIAVRTDASTVFSRLGDRTKLRFARGLDKASLSVKRMEGDEIVHKADKVKALVDSASKLHGWGQDAEGAKSLVNINLLGVDPSIL